MKKPPEFPTDSGQIEPKPERQKSPESPPQKTKLAKSKVQPIRDLSGNGPATSQVLQSRSSEPENGNGSEITPKKKKPGLPVPRLVDKRVRIDDALRRLNVLPEQVASCPPVTSFIRSNIRGGLKTALRAMRFDADETIVDFLRMYDSIPEGDRIKIPWEAIVIALKIDVKHFLGAITFALQNSSVTAVKFIALSHYPEIMKKQVQYAKDRTGERDRAAMNLAMGFTPSPKAPTFIGKAVFGGEKITSAEQEDDDPPEKPTSFAVVEDINNMFPNAPDTQQKMLSIRHRLPQTTGESQ
jgi:hypothetical protein